MNIEIIDYKDEDLNVIISKIKAIYDNNIFLHQKGAVIRVSLSWAVDEFALVLDKTHLGCIEVVTPDVAKRNDIEELSAIPALREQLNNYKLGEKMSSYKKLGNSEFYYKEL